MMQALKVSELTGAALDWAVAKCEGLASYEDAMLNGVVKRGWWVSGMSIDPNTWHPLTMFNPSTDWAQGGPIIEREGINLFQRKGISAKNGRPWLAYTAARLEQEGITPLIASMRCYVASKLGDVVEIPDQLFKVVKCSNSK